MTAKMIFRFTATLLAATLWHALPATAQGTLRIGMTASDIPLTTGQADQGGEGQRFMVYTVYDALVNWDLTSATKPSSLTPGLALSWTPDAKDRTKWIFKMREGAKYHDGSEFSADAAVWCGAERLLIRAVDALHDTIDIPDALWRALSAAFSREQILEVIALCGFYRTVAYYCRALRLPTEAYGAALPRAA